MDVDCGRCSGVFDLLGGVVDVYWGRRSGVLVDVDWDRDADVLDLLDGVVDVYLEPDLVRF